MKSPFIAWKVTSSGAWRWFFPKFLSARVTTRKYEHDHPRNPGFLRACPAHSKSNSDVKIICLPSSSKFPKNITPMICVSLCLEVFTWDPSISNGFLFKVCEGQLRDTQDTTNVTILSTSPFNQVDKRASHGPRPRNLYQFVLLNFGKSTWLKVFLLTLVWHVWWKFPTNLHIPLLLGDDTSQSMNPNDPFRKWRWGEIPHQRMRKHPSLLNLAYSDPMCLANWHFDKYQLTKVARNRAQERMNDQ